MSDCVRMSLRSSSSMGEGWVVERGGGAQLRSQHAGYSRVSLRAPQWSIVARHDALMHPQAVPCEALQHPYVFQSPWDHWKNESASRLRTRSQLVPSSFGSLSQTLPFLYGAVGVPPGERRPAQLPRKASSTFYPQPRGVVPRSGKQNKKNYDTPLQARESEGEGGEESEEEEEEEEEGEEEE